MERRGEVANRDVAAALGVSPATSHFRVFAREHPEVTLEPVGMNEVVAFMVARAKAT